MTTVAIHQPNFFPWAGYFDKIKNCDYFVFLDDVQYTRGSMMNRANICSHRVTCPVHYKFGQKINQVTIADQKKWKVKLLKMLYYKYGPDIPAHIYNIIINPIPLLSLYNSINIMYISGMLKTLPKKGFVTQSELGKFQSAGQELIADIVGYLGGDTYYSGVGAKDYMDVSYMNDRGIKVVYQDITKFPDCSIIDCILDKTYSYLIR